MSKKKKNNDWKKKEGVVFSTDQTKDNPFAALQNLSSGDLDRDEKDHEDEQTDAFVKQYLKVYLRRLKGNKIVTAICDFDGDSEDIKLLGKVVKTKCGGGGSVKDGEILIQGNHRDKVVDLLTDMGHSAKKAGG